MRSPISVAMLAACLTLALAYTAVARPRQTPSTPPQTPSHSPAPAAIDESTQNLDTIKAAEANFEKEAADADARFNQTTAADQSQATAIPPSNPSSQASVEHQKQATIRPRHARPTTPVNSSAGDLFARLGADFEAPRASGIPVRAVRPGTPAAVAELHPGDILTHLDGKKIRSLDQLHARLLGPRAGEPAILRILRQGTPRNIRLAMTVSANPLFNPAIPAVRAQD